MTLLAAYGFEQVEVDGNTFLDLSGNGHVATKAGAVQYFQPGKDSVGCIFNAAGRPGGSGVTIPRTGLEPTTAIGFAMWVINAEHGSNYFALLSKGRAAASDSYAMYSSTSGNADKPMATITTTAGTYSAQDTAASLADANWHFLAGTYDGTTLKFYRNNGATLELIASTPATGTLVYDATDLGILTSLSFPGQAAAAEIDNVWIWDHAPDITELTSAMNTPIVPGFLTPEPEPEPAASTSILQTTKKMLGLPAEYTVFDLDVMTHINAVFFTLNQLGIGPAAGFMIEDAVATWADYNESLPEDVEIAAVKTYMYVRVRLLFDPPTTSYHVTAVQEQIKEMEWRLNVNREDREWTDPTVPTAS